MGAALAAPAALHSDPDRPQATTLPPITIITPCRNGGRFIAEAIDSVARQRYPAFEHIVMDACSSDGTLEILARYPHLRVVSEPDTGSHDAMNKAIARASGEIIAFLNVDDLYPEGTLATVGAAFATNPDADIVAGRVVYFDGEGSSPRPLFVQRAHPDTDKSSLAEIAYGTPGFNGHFFRRQIFERVGTFDISYHLCADRHLLLRAALARLSYHQLDNIVVLYRVHPASATMNPQMTNLMPIAREHVRMSLEFAQRSQAEPALKQFFLDWHAFEGAKLLLRSMLRGRRGEMWASFVDMGRNNPWWLMRLPRARRLNRFARGLMQPAVKLASQHG
jgi:glycosyltransferase involved in cell wall biosynthesis